MTVLVEPVTGVDVIETLRERPVVLFGAGTLGQRIHKALLGTGIHPRAFADNNRDLWGKRIGDTEILSPEDAARRFAPEALFVMAVWRPTCSGGLRGIDRQLRDLGCENVIPFPPVLWAFPDLLPHYLWDLPSKMDSQWAPISEAACLFEDEASRIEYAAQVEFRRTGDFRALPPIQTHPPYFPEFLKRSPEEYFVDCGAFDGDSIDSFVEWTSGRFRKIAAFEADPANFRKLQKRVSDRPEIQDRIVCHPLAVAARAGTVHFNAIGLSGSSVSDTGGIEVRTVTLDEILRDEDPTFIKMDIEGSELDALIGGRETIRRARPILAVCVYHCQDHLWRLPLLIRELLPEARLFLKAYCLDGMETVCYAVPEHRLIRDRGLR